MTDAARQQRVMRLMNAPSTALGALANAVGFTTGRSPASIWRDRERERTSLGRYWLAEHEGILNALETRDRVAARERMVGHINAWQKFFSARFREAKTRDLKAKRIS